MTCCNNWPVVRWEPALLLITTVVWATGIKIEPNDKQICSILSLEKKKHTGISLWSRERSLYLLQNPRCGAIQVSLFFFPLNYCIKNHKKNKFTSNLISHSLWPYQKKNEVQQDTTNRTTEPLEASPPYLICTQSQFQYSQPFFSPSSDSVRALSLMGRRDADGWMTVG